jgi:hypothetical protein
MSSTYGPRVRDATSGVPVPQDVASAISDQVGAAMQAASRIGGEPGRTLADVASRGFADGMGTAFLIGAAALALGAVIVALFLPARARDVEAHEVPTPGSDRNQPITSPNHRLPGPYRSIRGRGDRRGPAPAGAGQAPTPRRPARRPDRRGHPGGRLRGLPR